MPCIHIHTNRPIPEDAAAALKKELGGIISILPHKTEEWLMVVLEDTCSMSFHGCQDRPFAFAEVKVWGSEVDRDASIRMTGAMTGLLEKYLHAAPDDQYIRYIATMDWGWNGTNF